MNDFRNRRKNEKVGFGVSLEKGDFKLEIPKIVHFI